MKRILSIFLVLTLLGVFGAVAASANEAAPVEQAAAYTVTYQPNINGNVKGLPASQTKEAGVDLALSADVPTREGYKFLGWATDPKAAAATVQPGASYTADADLTLYAVWQTGTKIIYIANGAGVVPSTVPNQQLKTPGVAVRLSTTKPTRVGYAFMGWSTDPKATVAKYPAGGEFDDDVDTTLYAVWDQVTPQGFWSGLLRFLRWVVRYVFFGWAWGYNY